MLSVPSAPRIRERSTLKSHDHHTGDCHNAQRHHHCDTSISEPTSIRATFRPHAEVKQQDGNLAESDLGRIRPFRDEKYVKNPGYLIVRIWKHPNVTSETQIRHLSDEDVGWDKHDPAEKDRVVVPAVSTSSEIWKAGKKAGHEADCCEREHGPGDS